MNYVVINSAKDIILDIIYIYKQSFCKGNILIIVCVTVEELRKSWTCSSCQVAAHTNMIECDGCALWYDW